MAAITSVHVSLMQHTEALQAALVEPELAHFTLMVTALDTNEEVCQAEAALDTLSSQLQAERVWSQPLSLSLQGLSHFRHQVKHVSFK